MTIITGTLYVDVSTFMTTSRWIHFEMKNLSDRSSRENRNTYFIFSNVFPKIVPLWSNVEKHEWARHVTDGNTV